MVISRTPYRISFFGGGTDYPAWYLSHGGSVLSTTIDKYCYISCRHLPPFFDIRYRVVYSKIELCNEIAEIVHPAVREAMKYLKVEQGIEIHHNGDLPARSGMGSSSAFMVGLLNGLYALKGQMPGKKRLALESIDIEQNIIGENVGSQDQFAVAHGGLNRIVFAPNGEITTHPITISRERMTELNGNLMLFFTGINRTASEVARSYLQDMDSKKRHLRIMGDLVDESISILSSDHSLDAFGELLHEAWETKRALSSLISNPYIESIYDQARRSGALGGKLLGAGGGGFMLLYVPVGRREEVRNALSRLIHVPFRFEFAGTQIIFLDQEQDYEKEENMYFFQDSHGFQELTKEGVVNERY
jgi:D-glycero-alpha-D-manno-heptose-7-phosphate kinase